MKKSIHFFARVLYFLAATTMFAFSANYNQAAAPDPEEQRMVTIIDSAHKYDLNPHTSCYSSESLILSGLYEGLFTYDPATLEPIPAIASSYKMSRDKKRWTFIINDNIQFSNGDPITAQTFYDSWISLLATPNAPFASLIDCIKGATAYRTGKGPVTDVGIEVKDEHTLVVVLNQPAEQLLSILCHASFCAVSDKPNVYSGAFVLQSYENGKLVMVKNEKYHGAAYVFIPGITVIQNDDAEENAYLFNTGKVDWISSGLDSSKLLNQDAVHVYAEFGTQYIFFKGQNKPWNDAGIRAALLEAIPWDELRKDYIVPASTLVYALNGYPTVLGLNDNDAGYALSMMQDARKRLGIPADQKLSIVYAVYEGDVLKKQAEILKKAWEPLGVELTVQTTPFERYNGSIPGWNADLFSYTWLGDFADPLAMLELFRGGSSLNITLYNSERYNNLLDKAANASDSAEHNKYLSQAEQCLLDDAEIIPVSHPVSFHAIDMNSIGGWTANALDYHPLKYLYIKHRETTVPNLVLAK